MTQVFVMGSNKHGQIGIEGEEIITLPKGCHFGVSIQKIHCGYHFTLLLVEGGWVYSMGANLYGNLGIGNNFSDQKFPQMIPSLKNVTQIIAGGWHSGAITENNELYLWGLGEEGQLGFGNSESIFTPQLIAQNCKGAVLGGFHTIYWDEKNCYSCGRNTFGQLGIGSKKSQNLMVKLAIQSVQQVVCGENHSLFLRDDQIYGCGDNTAMQLGRNDKKFWQSIEQLLTENKFKQICTGRKCSGGITLKGEFLIWGNFNGEMRNVNQKIHSKVRKVNLMGDSCIFENENNEIYSFGKNNSGELGQGDLENRNDPSLILKNVDVNEIALGENHSFILCRGSCKEEMSEQSFCDMMCNSLFKEDSFFSSSRNKENIKMQSHQSSAMQQLMKDKKIADLQLKLSQKDQIILRLQQRVQQLEKELQYH